MRAIDLDEAIERFIQAGQNMSKDQIIYMLNRLPVTEIVRCKDCTYHAYEGDVPYCSKIDYGYGWKDNDFCSKGRKRK